MIETSPPANIYRSALIGTFGARMLNEIAMLNKNQVFTNVDDIPDATLLLETGTKFMIEATEEILHRNEPTLKIVNPRLYGLTLPDMSPSLP